MKTEHLIKEIQKLPVKTRMYVIERSMYIMRKGEEEDQMKKAVNELYEDYITDKQLTIFTTLDLENFYETKWNLVNKPGIAQYDEYMAEPTELTDSADIALMAESQTTYYYTYMLYANRNYNKIICPIIPCA